MRRPIDYTGKVFNQLTALNFTGTHYQTSGGNRRRIWRFKCTCGKECDKIMEKVVKGDIKSCGCRKTTRTSLETLQHQVWGDYGDGDLTDEQFVFLSQKNCFWCGSPPSNTRKHRWFKHITWTYNGLDRIDTDKPHNSDNVVTSCWPCNQRRSNTSFGDFMNWISTCYHRHFDKIRFVSKPEDLTDEG